MKLASITIRISEDEKEAVKAFAELRDIPVSQVIREAIKNYIQKEEN